MSRTPEHAPVSTTPEYSAEERGVFSLAQLEQWRAYLKDDLAERRNKASDPLHMPGTLSFKPDSEPSYVTEFIGGIDSNLDKYLESQGLPAEVKDLFRSASIDKINDREWDTSPASRAGDPDDARSQSDIFREKIDEYLKTGSEPKSDHEAEKAEREQRINEARVAVEEAREQNAIVSAKRQGRVLRRNVKGQASAYRDYNEKVNHLGRLELEDVITSDDVSDEDKNVAVIEYLFKEQAKLRELTTEKLKNTKVSKFIAWMNKGGIVKRVLKGGGLGLVAGASGALLGGLAGAGFVAAGSIAGARFVRGFALGDKDKRGMRSADESIDRTKVASQLDDTDAEGDVFDKASSHFDTSFENDTRKEQNKRRRAAVIGLGVVAVGEIAGHVIGTLGHHSMQTHHSSGGHDTQSQSSGATNSKGMHPPGQSPDLPVDQGHSLLPTPDKAVQSIDHTPKLPVISGEYPWNRMGVALQKGIITPPKGMGAEQALHHYAQVLSENGDKVRWERLSGGREYLVVNGNDNTGYVWDHILSAAQKAGDVANR